VAGNNPGEAMSSAALGVLSVMMPIYNEERTVEACLNAVLARPEVGEVIAVDDGSRDRSWEILWRVAAGDSRVRPLRLQPNQGKGAALRRAIGEISRPYAIVQDADLELDPADYSRLLEPLLAGRADVVYGYRSFPVRDLHSLWFALGNMILTLVTDVLFFGRVRDMETCYKVLPAQLWKDLRLKGDRFEIEPEVTAKVLLLRKRLANVPITYAPRTVVEGKKIGMPDGLQALVTLFSIRAQSRQAMFGSTAETLREPEAATLK
jgi:glycosyltransferase involved in cell wall biosynthesis